MDRRVPCSKPGMQSLATPTHVLEEHVVRLIVHCQAVGGAVHCALLADYHMRHQWLLLHHHLERLTDVTGSDCF
jgi:hypothetical protein